jgi:hypothetical protein
MKAETSGIVGGISDERVALVEQSHDVVLREIVDATGNKGLC